MPDDDLVYLYNRAYALVQPSLMEGFGLPPVEAMACGTPVLASTAGSLPEVVGDAGVFFDPTDVAAIAEAMRVAARRPGRARPTSPAGRSTAPGGSPGPPRPARCSTCFEELGPARRTSTEEDSA